MKCHVCGVNVATIHFAQVINGKKSTKRYCESCYQKSSAAAPLTGYELSTLLEQNPVAKSTADLGLKLIAQWLTHATSKLALTRCPECGVTGEDLQKRGLVGCGHDYEVFGEDLLPLIERLHGKTRHVGKAPSVGHELAAREERKKDLKGRLDAAVRDERYEEAARYRDELKDVEKSLEGRP
jgi:protein arginine kinase activator